MRGEILERGDILRFPVGWHRHDDKSMPLDMMVRQEESQMALTYCTGYDAGFTLVILPRECESSKFSLSIRVDWLLSNWEEWFSYDAGQEMKVIPLEGVTVLPRQSYSIQPVDQAMVVDMDEPNDPDDMLDRARDCMIVAGRSTIARLLHQPAGHFSEMSSLAPGLDLGTARILISWQHFNEDGWAYMLLYFDPSTLKSVVTLHTEHWKTGLSEH